MKILFIFSLDDILSPEKPLRNQDQIQFGISYISSVLKKAGHETSLVVISEISGKKNYEILDKKIGIFQPDVVAFTAVATEYDFIINIAGYIKKKWPNLYRVAGGPHVTLNPEKTINDNVFNAICVGEGEYPTLELIEALDKKNTPSDIKNMWFYNDGNIQKNEARNFLDKLDILPFPDREMWQEWIDEQPGSRHAVILGRGCPFDCSYCCNHALRKVANGQYYRMRSPENIISEINYLAKTYPDNTEIYLEVETIGIDMDWSVELCKQIKELNQSMEKSLTYGINLRITPNQDLETLFRVFKDANFRFVNIGLESGSDKVRREVLKRYYSNEDVFNAVKIARKHDIKVAFFNMIGLPGETKKDFKETVAVNRRCQPDWHFTSIFFPYPGTELYRICDEGGLLNKKLNTRLERSQATLDMPGFSKRQIQKSYIWFDYYVYKGRRPLLKILYEVATKKLRSKYYFKYLFNKTVNGLPVLAWLKRTVRKKLVGEAYVLDEAKKVKEM